MKMWALIEPADEIGTEDCFFSIWSTPEMAAKELARAKELADWREFEIREIETDQTLGCFPQQEPGLMPAPKIKLANHELIHGAECCYGNSGHGFQEGYDFYSCSCGEWQQAYKNEQAAAIAHQTHALQRERD